MNSNDMFCPNEIDNFDNNFINFLYIKSRLLFNPALNLSENDEYNQCKTAFHEMEKFIFGSEILLAEGSVVNSVCGKSFKPKEQAYICRDCATDTTCRFCRACFVKSEHIKHNYQLFTSNGGGYCDCGDNEAWKMFPRCSIHGANSETLPVDLDKSRNCIEDVERDLAKLPDGIKIRFLTLTKLIFDQFKYYILRPLCKDSDSLRREALSLELDIVGKHCPDVNIHDYALVLYNNEIHNFDQVINLFKRSLTCSAEQAMEFANIVDRDGRCVAVSMKVLKDIELIQQDILMKSKTQTKVELLCRIHHPMILAIQNLLLHSLRWLLEFVNQYPLLRLLLGQYLFYDIPIIQNHSFSKSTFLQDVFENHIETWKMARSTSSHFVMTVAMQEPLFKRQFSIKFVTNYRMIITYYSIDDHNIQDSLMSLTCQIFTIISMSNYLLENNNVLASIIQIAYDELLKHSKPLTYEGIQYDGIRVFHKDENELHKKFDPYERHLRSFGDVKFLLTSLLTYFTGYDGERNSESASQSVQQWTEKSVDNFLKYFNIFANILSLIQDTNTIERIFEHHIERDPQWRTGIILMYDLVPCITLTSNLIISNPICLSHAFDIFRNIINDRLIKFESKKRILFEYSNFVAHVIDNESPNKFISVIKPLHRFMCTLLHQHSYLKELTTMEVDCLFDQALQMIVFASQQTGNMWIRNGSVPYILTQQMRCLTLSSEMFDRDVELIQQLALCMRPEEFILKCIHKFDLKHYFTTSSGILSDKKSLIQRVEDFLYLLIITLFFRHRPNVGKGITREKCYEHMLLHILSIKPMAHSKLMRKLPASLEKYPKIKLMKIIDNVADQTELSQIVMFNAKKDLIINNFDRFSLYYSIQDRNEAELYVQNILKKEIGSEALIPPNAIELSDDFSGLYRYLSDPCLLMVLDKILLFCNGKRNKEYWTDTILDMVLYLIGACLLEDIKVLDVPEQDQRRTLFLNNALKPDLGIRIIDSLESLADTITVPQQHELIKWTIRKWYEVKKRVLLDRCPYEENIEAMEVDDESTENASAINQLLADDAKIRRLHLMNKMRNMQNKFLMKNQDLLLKPLDELNKADKEDLTCILCQEKSNDNHDRPIIAIAGAWRSTVLAKHPFTSQTLAPQDSDDGMMCPVPESSFYDIRNTNPIRESYNYEESSAPGDIDRVVVRSILPMLDHPEETFITTCGHVMHYDCKTRYMSDMIKHRQNIARTKGILYPRIFNRCPLCKCVSNIDIPIIRQKPDRNNLSINKPKVMSFDEWLAFFAEWTPQNTTPLGSKKQDRSMYWWDKLGSQLSNIMKMTIPFKRNDSQASDDELLSCLAFRVGLAIKLQPRKLTKETYTKYESVSNSISESSMQDLIELDYAISYTISVWEQILSKNGSSLLTDMPERHITGLYYLIKAVSQSHEHLSEKDNLNRDCQHFLKILHQMLFNCTKSYLHFVWFELHKYKIPIFILEIDFVCIATSLLFMRSSFRRSVDSNFAVRSPDEKLPKFLQKSSYDMYVIRFIFQFVSIQALLSLQTTNVDNVELTFSQLQSDSPDLWTEEVVDKLYRLRMKLSRETPSLQLPNINKYETVALYTRAVMPFLRCSTFLLTAMGSLTPYTHFANCDIEFNQLIRVLGLGIVPDFTDDLPLYVKTHLRFIGDNQNKEILTIWGTKLPHMLPHSPPHLIDLPLDFTDVMTLCLERGCSLRQQSSVTVTEMSLCLICGDTFCLNGYCCRRPEDSSLTVINGAHIHSRQCHGGYSLFLNTRNTKIVVMFYQARWQITLDPIYVDQYGENDIDLTKGNPLFLKVDAYRKLERRWLDHSLGSIVNDGYVSHDFFV